MPSEFQYDLFLSHSAKDKAVVRPLAERLRQDGLKVWFDECVLKPGDSIPAKIEEGLEHSNFGFRISDFGLAQPGLSANVFGVGSRRVGIGGRHVWEGQQALSRLAEPAAPLPSPAA